MGAVKNAFHDEIIWNGLDENERQDALYYASADTHPTGGDTTQIEAPASLSGAVGAAETTDPGSPHPKGTDQL